MSNRIDVTGIDLVKFAQKVYELSSPQGLGFLHFTPEPLSKARAEELVEMFGDNSWTALDMDYVDRRACKMTVRKEEGKLSIQNSWYDHTDGQFKNLLSAFDLKAEQPSKHNHSCNCENCRKK